MKPRRASRQIVVGDDRVGRVAIGGGLAPDHRLADGSIEPAPVSVQTMTAGYTHRSGGVSQRWPE